jgi:hypothetical protein
MIPEEIEAMTTDFYRRLFTAQSHIQPSDVVQFVPRKVTDPMNDMLNSPFSKQEVTKALFMMHPNKAPGPDGFTTGFYQKHKYLIKEDVTRAVVQFLNGGDMTELVNNMVLAHILKVKNPQELTNFRIIALCNVLYKICSKMIANRLRQIIGDVMSEDVVVLRLDLRVEVLMRLKNNGTQGTRRFRQVRASLWIKTLRLVRVGVL